MTDPHAVEDTAMDAADEAGSRPQAPEVDAVDEATTEALEDEAATSGIESVDDPGNNARDGFGAQSDHPAQSMPDAMENATRVVEAISPDDADDADDADDEPETSVVVPDGSPRGPGLDPGIRDILKSEAEREARLRQAEMAPVETQAEMSLEEEAEASNRARRRAMLEDAEDAFEIQAKSGSGAVGSRRDLFPDIEEINSTLRATPDAYSDAGAAGEGTGISPEARRRRGVRIGFFSTLGVVTVLAWVYLNAGSISEQMPQAAPALDAFAGGVDGARLWLDSVARSLAEGSGDT